MFGTMLKRLLDEPKDVGHDEEEREESPVGVAVVHGGDEGEEVDEDGQDPEPF